MSRRWALSPHVVLDNDRVPAGDSARQYASAVEICERLNDQPGVILADDVGMGKTFVALAVAVSVAQASKDAQVVIMVPSAVADKWPNDWSVFREKCMRGGREVRATETTITRGSEFLKLLDDTEKTRKQIIFVTHWAMSSNLQDPFIKLALIREAFLYQRNLQDQRAAFPRWARKLLGSAEFTDERVEALLRARPKDWMSVWNRDPKVKQLDDDPVPASVIAAFEHVDHAGVRDALAAIPLRSSEKIGARLRELGQALRCALNKAWGEALRHVTASLPLLILDEAHHLKNPNNLRSLFDTGDDANSESLKGALGNMFGRMMLLTATPFQLGHRELVSVLGLFGSTRMPKQRAAAFATSMSELLAALDAAQGASQRLDRAWARLTPADVEHLPDRWWADTAAEYPERVDTVRKLLAECTGRLEAASEQLRPWVVRHSKERFRTYLPGATTHPGKEGSIGGLEIENQSVLPFLLAARAQSYVALKGLESHAKARAVFADGLASSFEAYLSTRDKTVPEVADDGGAAGVGSPVEGLEWYLDRIESALPRHDSSARARHPKVHATVERVLKHWREGEKVLVFCFYRATGRALREHLSTAIANEIAQTARDRFGIVGSTNAGVFDALGDRAKALLRTDRPGGRAVIERASAIGRQARLSDEDAQVLGEITLRFIRTPAYITRYVDLNQDGGEAAVANVFDVADGSGLTLGVRLASFAGRLSGLTAVEREGVWRELRSFSTGTRAVDSLDSDDEAEVSAEGVMLVPNVHLANGETDQSLRRRLMTTFNTPFLPEVLVASSVMAEGVDLHRECRHIIHHDLDWNPSTLEQRTGRVDRLGSKSSLAGLPIEVCEPYVAGTQDEKQYRVVKDRERWFGVLMGGRVPEDEWATDRIAERVPLPEELQQMLTLDLSVWSGRTNVS